MSRRLLVVLGGLCAACALGAPAPAGAATTHGFVEAFGSFQSPQALAVQQGSGDVLVVNTEAQRVERFTAAGAPAEFSALGSNAIDGAGGGECPTVPSDCDQTPQGGFAFGSPAQAQVAVDESGGANNGDIYVTNTWNGVVDVFAADGRYLGQLSETKNGGFGPVCGVAVDRAGNVFVADMNGAIHRFQPFTAPVANSDFVMDMPVPACELAVDGEGDVFAATPYGPVSKYDPSGSFEYQLDSNEAQGLAVDPVSGNVYVAEASRVVQFDASSTIAPVVLGSFGEGHVTSPGGVAVYGATGEAFVSDTTSGQVARFGPGVPAPDATTGPASGVTDTKATLEGAVNPDGTATEWQFQYGTDTSYGNTAPASPQSAGNGTSEVPVSTELTGLAAGTTYHYRLVAVGENGTTYGADQTFTTQAPPSVDSQSAEPVGKTTATLNAQINPFDAETTYHFEYGSGASYGTSTPDTVIPAGWGDQPASAELSGLTPGATYHYRVVATNSLGGPVDGSDQTFTTSPIASFRDIYTTKITATEATLNAEIDPLGEATTYRFEYGPTEAYGTSVPVPDGNAGAGSENTTVSQLVTGLSEGTTYHYRVIATNTAGTLASPDHTFATRTAEVPVADTCANSAVRAEQHSSFLTDCRAYEMVSPPDKNGGDIPGDGVSVTAASDGEAVAFTSRGSFGDTIGAGAAGQTMYVARRGTGGWRDHGATPSTNYEALVSGGGIPAVLDFSTDLSRAVVFGYDLPGVNEQLRAPNLYSEDTVTGGLSLMTQPVAGEQPLFAMVEDYLFVNPVGVSDDSEHVAFTSRFSRLLEEAPVGAPSVYEWDNGTLRLASVLPDGSIVSEGAELASPNRDLQQAYRQTVSRDGSRVLFLSPASRSRFRLPSDAQLYERVDHSRTVWISEPEMGGPAPAPKNIVLQQMTGDSRHVIFTTTSKLVPADTDNESDIYLYTEGTDPSKELNLTLVGKAPGRLGVGSTPVIGSSEDGSWIYYATDGGAIAAWHNGQTKIVENGVSLTANFKTSLSATASTPGAARVSPDGRFMAFMASGAVAGGEAPLVGDPAGRRELFLYDAISNRLRCVSCPGDGPATADSSIVPKVTTIFPSNFVPGTRPSFLASDGKVFFSTTQSLVAQDTNGVEDAYEYDPANERVSLLSTGTSSQPAAFVGASEIGNDVFIVTRAHLVGADRDGFVDMYDVRVHGGFPEPLSPPQPCVQETCQGALMAPPSTVELSSIAFRGSEQQPAARAGGRLRVLGARPVGSHIAVRVRASSDGLVGWSGMGVRAGSRRLTVRGTYTLRIGLNAAVRAGVARGQVVRVRLKLVFTPPGSSRPLAAGTVTVTFNRSSRKGR